MTGAPVIDEGTLTWARRPGAARVLASLRERVEKGGLGARSIVPIALSAAERRDVGLLLGAAWEVSSHPVSVKHLRDALDRRGVALEDLLVAVAGPLRDRAGDRAAAAEVKVRELHEVREVLEAALTAYGAGPPPPRLVDGAVGAVTAAVSVGEREQSAREVVRVLDLLGVRPEGEQTWLAQLAADAFGDAHALDRTRVLGRLTARVVALLGAGSGDDSGGGTDGVGVVVPDIRSSEGWRAAWGSVGVACDMVSSMVLVLNLPLTLGRHDSADVSGGRGGEAGLAGAAWLLPRGEPVWITARMLRAEGTLAEVARVFVCENPSVVEIAADRLGARSAPLICTYGRPSLAAIELLRMVHRAGVPVVLSSDRDRGGELIRSAVLRACPDALDWVSGPEVYEEERLDRLLHDLTPKRV